MYVSTCEMHRYSHIIYLRVQLYRILSSIFCKTRRDIFETAIGFPAPATDQFPSAPWLRLKSCCCSFVAHSGCIVKKNVAIRW